MARPERPVDPHAGVIAAFANDLRALRRDAGSPSYRALSRAAFYGPTTLSQAAAGHRLPSLEVTLGYVRACGGDEERWRERWESVAREIGGTPDGLPVAKPARRAYARWLAAGAALAIIVLAAVIRTSTQAHRLADGAAAGATAGSGGPGASGSAAASRTVSPSDVITDYVDPKRSGCSADGTTIASAPARSAAGVLYGMVELRYSPSCRVAWTRYTPTPNIAPTSTVVIVADRPQPIGNTAATFVVRDGAVYSDVLLIGSGCVMASAAVSVDGRQVATAQAPCTGEPARRP